MFIRSIMTDDSFLGRLFTAADPAAAPPATEPPAVAPPAVVPPEAKPADQNNELNMWRRKAEDAQKKLDDAAAAEQKRQEAELSELEREKVKSANAEKQLTTLQQENLKLRLAKDLPEEALEFVTGTDEATITDQVAKLAIVYKAPPASGGTVTLPARGQQPSLDEQITAAEAAGNRNESIRLKNLKMRGGE